MSTLLTLPLELRLKIYHHLFTATTIHYAHWVDSTDWEQYVHPHDHALAILKTSRQTHAEANELWLPRVTLAFDFPVVMLDTLAPLPRTVRKSINHIRVTARPIKLDLPFNDIEDVLGSQSLTEDFDDPRFTVDEALTVLRGLQLDTLTVDVRGDGTSPEWRYETLDTLLKAPEGWKALEFISEDSKMLAYPQVYDEDGDERLYERRAQPRTWHARMVERDGEGTGAEVRVFRGREEAGKRDAVFNETTREEFVQEEPDRDEKVILEADEIWRSEEEVNKEMLVLVKRGASAHCRIRRRDLFKHVKDYCERVCERRFEDEQFSWKLVQFAEERYQKIEDYRDKREQEGVDHISIEDILEEWKEKRERRKLEKEKADKVEETDQTLASQLDIAADEKKS